MSLYWLQGFFCLHVPVFHPAPLGKGFFLSWFFQDKDPCIYFANITHYWSMNMIFLFWNSPRFKLAHKWPWKWAKNKMGLTIIVFSLFYLPVSCNIRILDIRCTCNRVFIFFKNVWLALYEKTKKCLYFLSYFLSAIDFCMNGPCQNGGTCQRTLSVNWYSCHCPSGYYGKSPVHIYKSTLFYKFLPLVFQNSTCT